MGGCVGENKTKLSSEYWTRGRESGWTKWVPEWWVWINGVESGKGVKVRRTTVRGGEEYTCCHGKSENIHCRHVACEGLPIFFHVSFYLLMSHRAEK